MSDEKTIIELWQARTSVAQDEVGAALKELREMGYQDVIMESRHTLKEGVTTGTVTIALWLGSGWKEHGASSISEAMQKVREWKEQEK
jgi:hypothetical protein